MVFNSDGIFNRASETARISEIKSIEELARMSYMNRKIDEYAEGKSTTIAGVINDLKENGYKIKEITNGENAITGISLSEENVTAEINTEKTVTYTLIYSAETTVRYFVEVQGKNYEILFNDGNITVNMEETNVGEISKKPEVVVTSSDSTIIEANKTEEGKILLTAKDKIGDVTITIKEINSNVTKKIIATIEDTIPPTLSNPKSTVIGLKIKISVTATDNYSGVKQINYSVSPNTVNNPTGTLTSGVEMELIASEEREYTISFTATDNKNNTSSPVTIKATTIMPDILSIEEAKSIINADNYHNFIGKKVSYVADGIWRVFYVEDKNNYFGDGEGRIYLKRDFDVNYRLAIDSGTNLTYSSNHYLGKLNPLWGNNVSGKNGARVAYFASVDYSTWAKYTSTDSLYVVGGVPVEMFVRAYNRYITEKKIDKPIIYCGIGNYGYTFSLDGKSYSSSTQNVLFPDRTDPTGVFTADGDHYFLCSPNNDNSAGWLCTPYMAGIAFNSSGGNFVCPMVCLK